MAAVNEIVLRVVVRDGDTATRVIHDIGSATNGMANVTRENASRMRQGLDSISEQLANTKQEAIDTALGFLSLSAIGNVASYAIAAATSFESLQARLKTMTGSTAAAAAAFADLQTFAKQTPYSLDQVVEGFIKLKSMGLEPSMDAMRSYGNTASAMGKTLTDMIEAVADAGNNDFERLREFGIVAEQEGNKVKLTFQGVTTEIGKNSAEIQRYLQNIGNTTFRTSLDDQMTGATVAVANFADSLQTMAAEIATSSGLFTAYKATFNGLGDAFGILQANAHATSFVLAGALAIGFGHAATAGWGAVVAMQANAAEARILAAADAQAAATAIAAAEARAIHAANLLREAEAAVAAASGMARLRIVQTTLIPAQQALAIATAEATAAMAAQATASTGLAAAGSRLLGVVGGIPGLLMIAAAGLYYMKTAHDETRHSVELADGSQYSFAESLQHVNKISAEYRAATTERQNAIRDEIADIISLTNQRKIEAREQLKYLADLDKQSADNGGFIGTAMVKWVSEAWNGDAKDNKAIVAETTDTINKLMPVYANPGKPIADATATTNTFIGATDLATSAIDKQATAIKQAIEVIHEHGDALKSIIESLARQRIELEQGKLAAEYYTHRLNGLTEAEAKAATGAGQYNAYLAERKKLAEEAIGITGGLVDQYNLELANAGLVIADDFSAAESAASKAISAADQYKSAISSAAKTFESTRDGVTAGAVGALAKTTSDFDALINKASQATGVSAAFIKAIAQQETGYLQDPGKRTRAVSPVGAGGVMQIMPDTGRGLGISPSERFDPEKNIMAGAQYLKQQLAKFGGSEALAAAAYNAGPGAVSKYNGVPPYAETQNYVRKVAAYTDLYRTNSEAAQKVVASTVPYWETLSSTAKDTQSTVVEYAGGFDNARVSAEMLAGLVSGKLGNETAKLLASAQDQYLQAILTGEEYRKQTLAKQQFLPAQQQAILQAEQLATYAEETSKIEADAFAAKNGMAAQYSKELEKQNLNQSQIAELVSQKMQASTDKILHDVTQQTLQLSMSANAWRQLELSQDGYNAAQIASIQHAEKLLATTKQIREAADRIGEGLLDGLMKGATGADGVIESLKSTLETAFADMVLRPTIQPITKAVSDGITGTLTGQSNPWSGLQQAYSQTMASIQAGGWQGAATTAGVAATVSSLFGGSQAETTGAAIGGAIGNAILPGVGGATGSVLGHLAGGLFEDDDSARASFTGGKPTDGFVNRAGNKLSAASAFGAFGFQEDGTHDLGGATEQELAALVLRMAQIDNAVAKFIPSSEIERIKQSLGEYQRTGLDFDAIIKDRLKIISTGLSSGFQGLIDFSLDADAVVARLDELLTIQQQAVPALQKMNLQIGVAGDAALIAATGLSDAAGGLSNLTTVAAAYYDAVYSETERKQKALEIAQQTIDAYNAQYGANIQSLAGLRSYVETLDLTQAANYQASLAAMGLADELQLLSPVLQSATEAAQAAASQQANVFGQYWSGIEAVTSNYKNDLAALESNYADQKQAYDSAMQAALGLRKALLGLKLSDLSTLTPAKKLAEARTQYDTLLRKAKQGDVKSAESLQAAGEELLKFSQLYFASSDPYSQDFAAVQSGWESVAGLLEDQQDPQQAMLAEQKALVAQVEREYSRLSDIFAGIIGGNDLQRLALAQISSLPAELAGQLRNTLDGLRGVAGTASLSTSADAAIAVDKAVGITDKTAQIISLYQSLLGRLPDTDGLKYWVAELAKFDLGNIAGKIADSTEYKNSHYAGLAAVPYDGYQATLHKDEAVIDARSMFALRKYGIPSGGQAKQDVVVNVETKEVIIELKALRADSKLMRAELAQYAVQAGNQRDAQLKQGADTERNLIRNMRMK